MGIRKKNCNTLDRLKFFISNVSDSSFSRSTWKKIKFLAELKDPVNALVNDKISSISE